MASHLNKDPYTYEREHNAFVRELRQFHDSRNTPFRHAPRINGREVDLCTLYSQVTARGGWHKVNDTRTWDSVLQQMNLPKCPNASVALKHIYVRYLDQYEKIHFLGEDPDDERAETTDIRGRKVQSSSSQVPMTYNHQQHELSDSLRVQLCLSQDTATPTEYDKLAFSLLSGLPNEVDFAINMCALLSNEGRHVLRLERCPRLLELLIAHAGVWSDTNPSIKVLLEESWSKVEGRRMSEFWEDTVEDWEVRELLGPWEGKSKEVVEEDKILFNLSRDVGIRDSEGQRVLQIAAILRNLAFEESNISVLASSPVCLKFLLLCAHCRWCHVRQLGLDTLGSLASEMVLDPFDDISTQLIFRTITRNLQSNDRFLIIRSLEMLIGLCQVEGNEDTLVRSLNNRVYEQVCAFLTIQDIMLLVYTLESLYQITLLGMEPCTIVSRIHGVIGVLISLITIEAQSYGPNACIAMKLVETPTPAMQTVVSNPPTPHKSPLNPVAAHNHVGKVVYVGSSAIPVPPGYQELDNEAFACSWLKATYEICTGRFVSHTDIYNDYQTACIKLGKKGLIGPTQLSTFVRSVFPHVMPRRIEGCSDLNMDGIRKRIHPLPVSILAPIKAFNPNSASGSPVSLKHASSSPVISIPSSPNRSMSPSPGSGHSPILKAQLSAPPRSPASPHSPRTGRPSPPSSPASNAKDSSTLIKSLLANKVNQNIQRQQQLLKQKQGTSAGKTPAMRGRPNKASNLPVPASSAPLTLEACLAIPVPNTTTLLTTGSNMATSLPTPNKFRSNSQLGAMLGHCDPPAPLPPPNMTKELMASQAAGKAKQAEMAFIVSSLSPPLTPQGKPAPKAPRLILPNPGTSPKMRINGVQRSVPIGMCLLVENSKDAVVGTNDVRMEKVDNRGVIMRGCASVGEIQTGVAEQVNTKVEVESVRKRAFPALTKDGGNELNRDKLQPGQRLQNGGQTTVVTQAVMTNSNVPAATVSAASPTATTSTTTIANLPSIFKCRELTNAQNSSHNPFSNLPPSLQAPQRPKPKGVLADLLDGKVQNDALFSMNGIIDKRMADKKTNSISNHQGETMPNNSTNASCGPLTSPKTTALSLCTTVPATSTTTALPKNCSLTNGESVNHVTNAVADALTSTLKTLPAAGGDRTIARHLNPNSCAKVTPMLVQSSSPSAGAAGPVLMPSNGGAVTGQLVVQSATIASGPIVSTANADMNAKFSPAITTNVRAMVNNRFTIVAPNSPVKSDELIGFPRVSMDQLQQLTQQGPGKFRIIAKRPSTENSDSSSANELSKRIRVDELPATTALPPAATVASISRPLIASKPVFSPTHSSATTTNASTVPETCNMVLGANPGLKTEAKPDLLCKFKLMPSSDSPMIVKKAKTKLESEPDKAQGSEPKSAMEESTSLAGRLGTLPSAELSQGQRVTVGANGQGTTTAPAVKPLTAPKLEYICEWKDCKRSFESPSSVFFHACKVHAPVKASANIPCLWENCDQMARQRLSLMTHLQDRHCNENILRMQAMRRQDLTRSGTSNIPVPTPPPPHPGYAPNAALHAIKRHALEFLNHREATIQDEKEGPVTRSVRFTAALILRNLIVNSSHGKKVAKQYEGYLATIAVNHAESSRTIAYCLAELGKLSEHADYS